MARYGVFPVAHPNKSGTFNWDQPFLSIVGRLSLRGYSTTGKRTFGNFNSSIVF